MSEGYLRFEGAIRFDPNIYLRFEGLVAKYKRPQNRMIPMAIGAQYPGHRVLATPRNVDRRLANTKSTP
ncbi:hypothetical protein B5U84_08055 [Bifidobacterium bifidum]|nr:hypothetical protein [Bifidobacterium bifidum]MBX9163381.1 hypothetical protein [Bifidobacterium bifidum]MCU4300490.1 hypothetical protein [Bifidobacterium bifidum]OSP25847.1 hypothetical protein BJL93_07735 [Bifidobacterium bifidum]PVV33543.1 hypothetical protein DD686_06375 [Bifidobacterium bifidum]